MTTHIFVNWENQEVLDAEAFEAVKKDMLEDFLDYTHSPTGRDLMDEAITDYAKDTVAVFNMPSEVRKKVIERFVALCKKHVNEVSGENYQEVFLQITT